MDIISHGLWGGVAFGRRNKKNYWWAFFFGVAPDFFSFGLFTIASFLGIHARPDWSAGPPPMESIPQYVHSLYNVTHSLVVFAIAFALIFLILKRPFWPMLAWAFHIALDIFTHTKEFFPTPFLWPVSDFKFSGNNWSEPYIFFPNVILLVILYAWLYFRKRRNNPSQFTIK